MLLLHKLFVSTQIGVCLTKIRKSAPASYQQNWKKTVLSSYGPTGPVF